MDKAWAGVILPTIALGFFMAIPYLDRSREGQGVWFGTKYAGRITIVAALYAIFISGLLVAFDAGDRTHTEYLTRWIPSCDAQAAHQTTPCLTDGEGVSHSGLAGMAELNSRLQFSVPFPHMLGINDGHLDWPKDLTNIPVPFNNICFQWHGQHLWCDMHINFPATMTQQILPLSTIAQWIICATSGKRWSARRRLPRCRVGDRSRLVCRRWRLRTWPRASPQLARGWASGWPKRSFRC